MRKLGVLACALSVVLPTAALGRTGLGGAARPTDPPRAAPPAGCPDRATGPSGGALVVLDTLMCGLLDSTGVRGGALAVSRNGRLVYARGFGVADEERDVAVTPASLFRIASLSKPLTATAVLKLAGRGELDLEAPALDTLIGTLVPPGGVVDDRIRSITLAQLLRHTAGWDRYAHNWDPMFASDSIARALDVPRPAGLDAILAYTLADSLQFTPGTDFAYSNVGYAFAGRLLEIAAGLPYEAVVRREVLTPAGMRGVRLGRTRPEDRAPREVRYYDDRVVRSVFPGEGEVSFPDGGFHLEPMAAHGGWIASVVDLMRFLVRVDGLPDPPDLLGVRERSAMLTPSANGDDYGMGWYVGRRGPHPLWWHMGDLPGSRALLVRGTGGVGFAALFNGSPRELNPDRLRSRLLDVLERVEHWPDHDLFGEYP